MVKEKSLNKVWVLKLSESKNGKNMFVKFSDNKKKVLKNLST